jgi:polysaccharide pyruvyl transferase WcaK-like protein
LNEDAKHQLNSLSKRFELGIDVDEYLAFIKKNCKVFFSVEEWASYIKTKDFSVGTRFHGNLIALLNGVPAVIFVHDSRTTEMCNFMKIPHFGLDSRLLENIPKLYQDVSYDEFSRNYSQLYQSYCSFLTENRVPHNLTQSVKAA